MKMRTAYFCMKCDEEIDVEESHNLGCCPVCGYAGLTCVSRVYTMRVEDKSDKAKVNSL